MSLKSVMGGQYRDMERVIKAEDVHRSCLEMNDVMIIQIVKNLEILFVRKPQCYQPLYILEHLEREGG